MDMNAPNWDLNNAIVSIYEAALEPTLWPSVLKGIGRFLKDAQVYLLVMDNPFQSCIAINGDGVYSENTYSDGQTRIAKEFQDEISSTAIGELMFIDSNTSLLPSNFIESKEFSSAILKSTFKTHKLIVPLSSGEGSRTALVINISNNTSPDRIVLIKQLAQHFMRSLNINNYLNVLKHRNDSMLIALQRINTPVFILNSDLQKIFINREADLFLKRQAAIQIDSNGRLQVYFAEEQDTLIRLFNEFLAKGLQTAYQVSEDRSLAVHHPDRRHPTRLYLLPIGKPDVEPSQRPFMAVFAYDLEQPRHLAPEYLSQVFKLTPSEIHMAQLLASGCNILQISEVRSTTLESTRWQMKQILQKTNTHSQAELVRKLLVLGKEPSLQE